MHRSDFNDEYLKPLSEKLISENKEVVLIGDFNIDLLKGDSNKNVSDFLTSFIPLILFLTLLLILD